MTLFLDFIRTVVENAVPLAITPREMEEASMEDGELKLIRECVNTGDWTKCSGPKYVGYRAVKEELCTYGGLVLRGDRIVVPQSLRYRVLRLAHEGHQGIVKTKSRLRTKVWWPTVDRETERLCRTSHGCQVVGSAVAPEPMARTPPTGPWQDVAMDLCRPLPGGNIY